VISFDLIDPSASEPNAEELEMDEAWRQGEMHSCVERHGGHLWVLSGEAPAEEWDGVELGCSYCCAGVDDLIPDGCDLIFGDLNGVEIRSGRHDSGGEFEIPVKVKLDFDEHFNPHEMIYPEYDAWIVVEPRD
jgi:hypothetical protein